MILYIGISLFMNWNELILRPLVSPHHAEGDCCPKCKRIIIDSSGYENNIE